MSLLDVESLSVSVLSRLELGDFCDSLIGSLDSLELDSVGSGELGLDSGIASLSDISLSSVTAEWLFTAMSPVSNLITSSGVSTGSLAIVELLYTVTDGLVRLPLYLFWDAGLLR